MIGAAPKDFWLSCGHHLLDRDEGGGLVVTDEFLKVYLARPELAPPPEACVVEKTLHAALLDDPRRRVGADEIAAMADADARENWTVMIGFRDHLLRHPTIEAAYLALIRGRVQGTPPLFINQLVHVILRNVLDGCEDPWVLRAAELFFRPQRITVHEGSLLAADDECEQLGDTGLFGAPSLDGTVGDGATAGATGFNQRQRHRSGAVRDKSLRLRQQGHPVGHNAVGREFGGHIRSDPRGRPAFVRAYEQVGQSLGAGQSTRACELFDQPLHQRAPGADHPPAVADGPLVDYKMCDWIDNAITLQMSPVDGPVYGYIHLPCRVRLRGRISGAREVARSNLG